MALSTPTVLASLIVFSALSGADARVGARPIFKRNPLRAAMKFMTAAPEERDCECINWQTAYYKKGVSCGQGNEIPEGDNVEGAAICRDMFERFDTNYCLNDGKSGLASSQWCYVDSKCTNLHGGEHVSGAEVSWKKCGAQDPMTRDLSVEELTILSKSQDISLHLLAKLAYPTLQHPVPTADRWMFAQRAWGLHDGFPNATTAKFGLKAAQFDSLNEIAQRKSATIILNSDAGTPPYGIVKGRRAYEVRAIKGEGRDPKHPSTFTQAFCLSGCSPWGWDPKIERDDADLSKPRQNIDH